MGNWTPERSDTDKNGKKGNFYCSPACGGKNLGVCTHERHQQAITESDLLASLMGEGWTTQVWENLGWHWEVISPCGRLKVHPSRGPGRKIVGYTAFLGEPDSPGGKWAEYGKTPQAAIDAVVKVAKAELSKFGAMIGGL
jgi:hypothetical protein